MSTERYDVIIVGSGAGGSAAAYRLTQSGKRVLLLEKGDYLPRDGSTLDVKTVFKEGRFRNQVEWSDGNGEVFVPGEYYNVGGKTKWYGAALLRMDPHEFEADPNFQLRGWPIDYEELLPYYEEAERLLHVNQFDHEPELTSLIAKICKADEGWEPQALPLGLKKEILDDPEEAKHFDGFASACGYKSDAEWNLLTPILAASTFTLTTNADVVDLVTDPEDLDQHGRLAVEARPAVVVLEAVDHVGDVREEQAGSIGVGEHDDVLELTARVRLPDGAEQDLPARRLDRATRQIERSVAHGTRHGVEIETVAAQGLLRDLDRDLVGTVVFQLRLGDLGQRGNLLARALAKRPELLLADEPTGALDLPTARSVLAILQRF